MRPSGMPKLSSDANSHARPSDGNAAAKSELVTTGLCLSASGRTPAWRISASRLTMCLVKLRPATKPCCE
eukprot:6080456-Pyramimonas_sp.AAC.1